MADQFPEDYHALYDPAFRASRGTQPRGAARAEPPGLERLLTEIPDLVVSYDEVTQLPNRIATAKPTNRLAPAMGESPQEAATQFVKSRGDVWNLSPEDTDTVEVVSVSTRGLKTVRLIQRVEGVEVFSSETTVTLSDDNEIISAVGHFFPGAYTARSLARAAPNGSETEAIARAAFDFSHLSYSPAEFTRTAPPSPDSGPYRFYQFTASANADDDRPPFERPVRLKDVMFPIGAGQFEHGYYMELWIKGIPVYSYVISAEDPAVILFRKCLTASVAFKYNVHNTGDAIFRPEDGPAPGSPHPTGVPDGFQAPTISETLIEIESLLPGRPWLAAGATTTSGNNCIAYADLAPPQGQTAGDVPGQITAPGEFNYTYDHTQPASQAANLQNSLVGMFFHVNWLHDRWYEAGFDEASGNAQVDNFGLGGLGGDAILAEGNDFSGTDNANMSTPADGGSPRMQMFEFVNVPAGTPSRTSNHEALITFHEMGHYITNRLVNDSTGLTNVQGNAMGEGWGDFFAISMTSQSTDNFASGVFSAGGWTDLTGTFNDNYYFSIRRYPYSADMTKNPLTFKHISDGVALPAGPPLNAGPASAPNSEEHNAGEVWCAALWEVFVNLVAKHGHAEAERRMLIYVIGGLKNTPNRPTYTEARDGIIITVAAANPEDLPEVWAGFAKRGMGVGAVSPARDSTTLTGVVESFDAAFDSTEYREEFYNRNKFFNPGSLGAGSTPANPVVVVGNSYIVPKKFRVTA